MRTFIASKLAVTAILTLFTLAFAWNLVQGSGLTLRGHSLPEAETVLVSHGPGIPPDPWEGVRVAHGPGIPPDPWEGVRVAHGPGIPPDPWEGVRLS